ncbi:MAG: hypothetical protein ACTSYD_03500 [Candidatus Heimdallarchaeaceae archaeon]
MHVSKSSAFAASILIILSISISTAFSSTMLPSSTGFSKLNDLSGNISPVNSVFYKQSIDDFAYTFNATVQLNRTINIETFGVLSLNDTILFHNVGNDTIQYFNYTLPNINTDKITYVSFYVGNGTLDEEGEITVRSYTEYRTLNYTTYRIPFYENTSIIPENSTFYIHTYIEFAQPYECTIRNSEQLLHYRELLYPLINNVPIINGTTVVNKQGGDVFVDEDEYQITPTNDTANIIAIGGAESGTLKWLNISRFAFNYSQSYNDDIMINVYLSSVSTSNDIEQAANTILFKTTDAYRRIEIGSYGLIKVTETQTIKFLGPEKPEDESKTKINMYALNAFPLVLPPNATILNIYDEVGGLNLLYQLDNAQFSRGSYNIRQSDRFPGHPAVVVFPRYPLYHGDEMTFTIVYTIPSNVALYRERGTPQYYLKITPFSLVNWTIENLNLDIVLPKGGVFRSSNYTSSDPYQTFETSYHKEFVFRSFGFKRIVTFHTLNFSPSDNVEFTIHYTYTQINAWIQFFFLILTVAAVICIYIGLRWTTQKAKEITGAEVKEFIPVEEIKTFVRLYEEKLGVQARIRETKDKVAAKKLKAKEGQQLLSSLEKRLRTVESDLKIAKENLIKHGTRYKEAVEKVEIAERKMIAEERNLRALRKEYRTRKTLTKEAYRKLLKERQTTIEKLRSDIDGVLVNLRLLIEE